MGLLSRIRSSKQHSETQADTFSPGDEVYISTLTKVFKGKVVKKDDADYHILNGVHYIVRTGTELIPVSETMLTPVNDMVATDKEASNG